MRCGDCVHFSFRYIFADGVWPITLCEVAMREKVRKRLVLVSGEFVGFLLVLAVIWLDEIIDLPQMLLGAEPSPINWRESLIETIFTVALGILVVYRSWKLLGELYHISGFLPVCSNCKRIRLNDKWVPLETYMYEVNDTTVSHGMCPLCMKALYPEYVDRLDRSDE